MTDATFTDAPAAGTSAGAKPKRRDIGLKGRYAAERRFRAYGLIAIALGLLFLVLLLWSVISKGYTAFQQTTVSIPVMYNAEQINLEDVRQDNRVALIGQVRAVLSDSVVAATGADPEVRDEVRAAQSLLSQGAPIQIIERLKTDPGLIGQTETVRFLGHGIVDSTVKGQINLELDESRRPVSDLQLQMINKLTEDGALTKSFNTGLFTFGASSRPETAGMGVAIVGSLYMMLIVLVLALPIGVAASIYLEEFAPKNRFTDLIEVNINNLAAVPSIVYGLLGLAVFINFAGLPRSASLVGGLVLTLMTLPTIIIATRAALKAVPPSIRSAALGVGASKMQTVFHHVLPLAAPGILTGTILGLAQALGETAPLLLIGMVAFVVEYPTTPLDPATALPVQIFMWANEAERAFVERTSGAIIVLLLFLAVMNITAIILRRRFERRW
ncbi:MAG: phosphate ABC transporter permease PstA [Pseudomonadota bacterium]